MLTTNTDYEVVDSSGIERSSQAHMRLDHDDQREYEDTALTDIPKDVTTISRQIGLPSSEAHATADADARGQASTEQAAVRSEHSLHAKPAVAFTGPQNRSEDLQALPLDTETVPIPTRVRTVPTSSSDKKIVPQSSLSFTNSSQYLRECESAAIASRLPPRHMSVSERALMKGHLSHLQITSYVVIRNGILRLWVKNPLLWVTDIEAQGVAREERHFALSRQIWEFLVRNGYINFGCLSVPKPVISPREQRNIVVVGAGIAGLTAARQLENLLSVFYHQLKFDYKVVVLEARSRIGGRVYSHPLGHGKHRSSCRVDLGAQIITGFSGGNPLTIVLQRQLACPYHPLIHAKNNKLHGANGHVISSEQDVRVEGLFNLLLESAAQTRRLQNPSEHALGSLPSKRKFDSLTTNSSLEETSVDQTLVVDKVLGIRQVTVPSDGQVKNPDTPNDLRKLGYHVLDNVKLPEFTKSSSLGLTMTSILEAFSKVADIGIADYNILQWHWANMEYACGTNLDNLSLEHWDQDDGNEFRGNHAMLLGGYSRLARGLALAPEALNVRTASIVHSITMNEVILSCGQSIPAEKIIVSVPLGVLKADSIQFSPSLPEWKLKSIRDLGYGLLNKIILIYEEQFWASDIDLIGSIPMTDRDVNSAGHRGRFYVFWNCAIPAGGRPVLTALMAGDAAFACEDSSEQQLVDDATALLQSIHPLIEVPRPSEYIITKWAQDPFSQGSYSYIGPNGSGLDYDALARPIDDHWFFAGEATCRTHPSTVHGAFLSGLAAARDVLDSIIGKQTISTSIPLVPSKLRPGSQSSLYSTVDEAQIERAAQDSAKTSGPGSLRPGHSQVSKVDRQTEELQRVIDERLGPRPVRPKRINANPFLVFQKDQWNRCRDMADAIQRNKQNKPDVTATKNQIRACLGQTWRETTESEKHHWVNIVKERKAAYEVEMLEAEASIARWEAARIAISTQLATGERLNEVTVDQFDHKPSLPMPGRTNESIVEVSSPEKDIGR